MKSYLLPLLFLLCISCSKELKFETQSFEKTTSVDCNTNCPTIQLKIPVAKNSNLIADSINNAVFTAVKSIIDFGDKPNNSSNYEQLANSLRLMKN